MYRRFVLTLSLIMIVHLLISACQANSESSQAPPTEDPVAAMQAALLATSEAAQAGRSQQNERWLSELDAAESRWETANIDKYTLTILYINTTQNITQYNTIRVDNGEIVEESAACSEQVPNCFINEIDTQNITVPGLFGMARNAITNDQINDSGTEFNFHPEHGVPEWIAMKAPSQAAWYWHIESFEILE